MKKSTARHYAKKDYTKTCRSAIALLLTAVIVFGSFSIISEFISVNAEELSEGQTKYANVSEFQMDRWKKIQSTIFKDDYTTTGKAFDNVLTPESVKAQTVNPNNGLFEWVPDDQIVDNNGNAVTPWDGTSVEVAPAGSNHEYLYDDLAISYKTYNIYTPQQFRWVLENVQNINATHIKINLQRDLNMNGSNGVTWTPIDTKFCENSNYQKYFYIEGCGYSIYNIKIYAYNTGTGAGLFARPPAFMTVKNLGFRSSMVLNNSVSNEFSSAGLIAAFAPQKFYFYNVHSKGGYYQVSDAYNEGGIGGLIGRKDISVVGGHAYYDGTYANEAHRNWPYALANWDAGDCFFENCSTDSSFMYGANHIGGMTSWLGNELKSKHRYDVEIPEYPEKYVMKDLNVTKDTSLNEWEAVNTYPIMFKNCSSTDCEIFSVGHDSGAFISCGSGIKADNCFTNNKIYSSDNTGGFVGRLETFRGPMTDDTGKYNVGSCFNGCYSSGIVEGKDAMGGFVGLDNSTRNRNTVQLKGNSTDNVHRCSNVYLNCYSTAMVGMDYAGKYCGGFVGLNDNYHMGVLVDGKNYTPTITVDNLEGDSKQISGKGSFFVNCYAAGEVGNVLTVTDIEDGKTKEKDYLANAENVDTTSKILDYYPTGGFVGAVGIDDVGTSKTGTGNFYNCYYDMQTTAMHEMAVGVSNSKTSRDTERNSDYKLTGVTGLYTQDAEQKYIPGLTGVPKDYTTESPNGKRFSMDSGGENSTVWDYNDEYYPQISYYMTCDTTLDNIINVGTTLDEKVKTSGFYIPKTSFGSTGVTHANYSVPVVSLADTDTQTNSSVNGWSWKSWNASSLAGVVRAYRYSQASTATVLLSNWSNTMNTASGLTGGENDWQPGLPANRMTKYEVNENGYVHDEWKIEYENLQAGKYEFKIQAGTSWAYNYGSDGFNGKNIVLNVPTDDCDVVIRFYCGQPKSTDYYVKADITPPTGKGDPYTDVLAEGQSYTPIPYTVVGGFPNANWNPTQNSYYTMTYQGDRKTYKLTIDDLAAGDYQFKITDGSGNWSNSYGLDGVKDGSNMSFKLSATADVTVVFDEETKLCTVTANPAENLTEVTTISKKIEFEGYAAVFSDRMFTGHIWYDENEDKVKESCEDGRLTFNQSNGHYERTFPVKITYAGQLNQNYAYKVIKDAVDEGINHYFYIDGSFVSVGDTLQVKISYNPNTNESTIESVGSKAISQFARVSSYSIIGDQGLTGYNWMSLEAAQAGEMLLVPGSETVYEKTYTDVPAGEYAFKIAADAIENGGNWGVDYGGPDRTNYIIKLKADADVQILFDKSNENIVVKSPALVNNEWVLSGVKTLMGEEIGEWNKESPVMAYNTETGLYEYEIENVKVNNPADEPIDNAQETPNYNYACKVIPKGVDQGENMLFVLKQGTQVEYDLKFVYDEVFDTLKIYAYDYNGIDVTDEVISYTIDVGFYSVLGDKELTGDSWGTNFPAQAAYDGWMKDSDGDGIYEKTYTIDVPSDVATQYSFKVVANGTFNSGLSWGNADGGNVVVSVKSDTVSQTTLKILFDSKNKTVYYELGDITVDAGYSGDDLVWYVAGTYMLRSNNAYKIQPEVYDTVRDITSAFTFTCGQGENNEQKGILWSKDIALNEDYGFFNEGTFSLEYSQYSQNNKGSSKSNNINTVFDSDVVKLDARALGELGVTPDNELLAQFFCELFTAGKQWLKVTTAGYGNSQEFIDWKVQYLKYVEYIDLLEVYNNSFKKHLRALSGIKYLYNGEVKIVTSDTLIEYLTAYPDIASETAIRVGLPEGTTLLTQKAEVDSSYVEKPADVPSFSQSVAGSRDIRLIPTAYLEAGNDAQVEIVQSKNDGKGELAVNNVTYDTDDENAKTTITGESTFNYYNFAVTAGYLTTDRVGLGIYNNYNDQNVTRFSEAKIRDDKLNSYRNSNKDGSTYWTKDGVEKDCAHRYFAMSSAYNNTSGRANDSYSDGKDRTTAGLKLNSLFSVSTIGSAYKEDNQYAQSIVKIFKIERDAEGNVSEQLVNTDDTPNATNEYALNYQKWTGQMNFNADDVGEYRVRFYWTLSDGRYLTSSKDVTILKFDPEISITVDPKYEGDTKYSGSEITPENTVTYKITYSNTKTSTNITFAVLDVLPFNGSVRNSTDLNGDPISYKTDFKNGEQPKFTLKNIQLQKSNSSTTLKGFYYTTNKGVQTLCDPSTGNAAENLNLTADIKNHDTSGYIGADLLYENGGMFKSFDKLNATDIDYQAGDYGDMNIEGITGLALTGVELGIGQSVDIILTLQYDGECDDLLINNAHYHAISSEINDSVAEESSIVSTTIVSRALSGYAWMDSDVDGIVDINEPRLQNMRVRLYKDDNGNITEVLKNGKPYDVLTDKDGLYKFTNLPNLPVGQYVIKFLPPESGDITYIPKNNDGTDKTGSSQTVQFTGLGLTYQKQQIENVVRDNNGVKEIVTDDPVNSVNLAGEKSVSSDGSKEYIISNISAPTDSEVGRGSYKGTMRLNYNQKGWQYTKYYLNAGFTANPVRNISGYAWLDLDNDGWVDANEPTLQNIKVYLYQNGKRVDSVSPALTDAYGRYEFADVDEGTYEIRFVGPSDGIVTTNNNGGKKIKFNQLGIAPKVTEADWNKKFRSSGNVSDGYNGSDSKLEYASTSEVIIPTIKEALNKQFPNDVSMNREYSTKSDGTINYNIYFRNVGFTYSDYSFDISKTGQDGEALANVEFILEQKVGNDWVAVGEAKTTDENGELGYSGLSAGEYRLIENSSVEGHSKLEAPLYLSFPYKVKDTFDGLEVSKENLLVTSGGYKYYSHIGITVVNPELFKLPLNGDFGFKALIFGGLGIFAVGSIILFVTRKRKKLQQK